MSEKYQGYGHALLRLTLGGMFLYTGISKLLNTGSVVGMLAHLGFPAPSFWAWLLLLSEIIFGFCVLVGYKVKYTVWPLIIVLTVATFTAVIPNLAGSGGGVTLSFHLLGIAALLSLSLTGPGRIAVDRE